METSYIVSILLRSLAYLKKLSVTRTRHKIHTYILKFAEQQLLYIWPLPERTTYKCLHLNVKHSPKGQLKNTSIFVRPTQNK